MKTLTNARGHTLVEMTAAMLVMSVGMVALSAALGRGTSFSHAAVANALVTDQARGPLARLQDLLTESSISHVDTSLRFHTVQFGDFASDRFWLPGSGCRQCPSPVCGFHTRTNLQIIEANYNCGFEYRAGLGTAPQIRGKTWPDSLTRCPYDGSQLLDGTTTDGLKMFIARGANGAFTTTGSASPSPDWGGLVLIFPCAGIDGGLELRRYETFVQDLVGQASYSSNWSRWTPNAPSMIDIFDFGTDGTSNGAPDGSVPVTAATSDADYEYFFVGTSNGAPTVVISKYLGSVGTFPHRTLEFAVRLADGYTTLNVSHYDTATTFWSTSSTFTRAPKTLATGVTEFAVSTINSNPHNAATNPRGVSEPRVVRVTLGTSQKVQEKGVVTWHHHVDTFSIAPRN